MMMKAIAIGVLAAHAIVNMGRCVSIDGSRPTNLAALAGWAIVTGLGLGAVVMA